MSEPCESVTPSPRSRAVVLWRLDDDPPVWIVAPGPTPTGCDDAVRVTKPPHGATEYVALPLADDARREAVIEAARKAVVPTEYGATTDPTVDPATLPVYVNLDALRAALKGLA